MIGSCPETVVERRSNILHALHELNYSCHFILLFFSFHSLVISYSFHFILLSFQSRHLSFHTFFSFHTLVISGKSHTMLGTDQSGSSIGIMPCAIAWLFKLINDQRDKTGARFSVRVSAVHVSGRQELLKDLLAEAAQGKARINVLVNLNGQACYYSLYPCPVSVMSMALYCPKIYRIKGKTLVCLGLNLWLGIYLGLPELISTLISPSLCPLSRTSALACSQLGFVRRRSPLALISLHSKFGRPFFCFPFGSQFSIDFGKCMNAHWEIQNFLMVRLFPFCGWKIKGIS